MKCKTCNNEIADNYLYCPFCGSQIVRKRTKRNEGIKIPTPQKRGSKWRIRLQTEGVSATFDTKEEINAVSGILALDLQSDDSDKAVNDYINQIKEKAGPERAMELLQKGEITLEEFNKMINNKG